MLFAFLVHVSGVVAPGTPAGSVLAGMIEHKADATSVQLLVRGILCNLLVCLAVWSAARLRSEGARLVVVFGCVMVFITSGFEHVVANMTTFSLGLYAGLPGASVSEMARNIALVGLGNLIGGALLVGAAYAYRSRPALPQVQTDTSRTGALPSAHVPADTSPHGRAAQRAGAGGHPRHGPAAQRPGAPGNTVTRNTGVTRRRTTVA